MQANKRLAVAGGRGNLVYSLRPGAEGAAEQWKIMRTFSGWPSSEESESSTGTNIRQDAWP